MRPVIFILFVFFTDKLITNVLRTILYLRLTGSLKIFSFQQDCPSALNAFRRSLFFCLQKISESFRTMALNHLISRRHVMCASTL